MNDDIDDDRDDEDESQRQMKPPPADKAIGDCCLDELYHEICKRSPAFVIAIAVQTGKDTTETKVYMHGNRVTCVGLSEMAKFSTMRACLS